jgi:hypothetical protein
MHLKVDYQKFVVFLFGLIVMAAIMVISFSVFIGFQQIGNTPVQLLVTATAGQNNSTSPISTKTKPISEFTTEKAMLVETLKTITKTPYDTPIMVPTGTRTGERVKFSGEKLGLHTLNGWSGILDGNEVSVYAGSLLTDAEQGAVVFLIKLPFRNYQEEDLTPTKDGGIRIVGEQNNRLILQSNDGVFFYYDLPARQFVGSLIEIVSTAELPPTYTPFVSMQGTTISTNIPYPVSTEQSTVIP